MAIILPAEGDFGTGQADQAGVGDGDSVRVSAEIGEHLSRSAKGRLGVDHPLDPAQFTQPAGEGGGFRECCKLAEEAEFPSLKGGTQLIEEQAAEEPREDAHRQEEPRATGNPARVVERGTAAGHEIADTPVVGDAAKPTPPTLEQFLSGLRTAWQEGEVRPTSVPKAKPKRLRRRPDPLAAVTTKLREWFEAEPWRTSRELFERLPVECSFDRRDFLDLCQGGPLRGEACSG